MFPTNFDFNHEKEKPRIRNIIERIILLNSDIYNCNLAHLIAIIFPYNINKKINPEFNYSGFIFYMGYITY